MGILDISGLTKSDSLKKFSWNSYRLEAEDLMGYQEVLAMCKCRE